MSTIMITIFLICLLVIFFINSFILFIISKLFKLNPTYKKSMLVTVGTVVGGTIVSIIFRIVNIGIISNLLVSIITFIVFYSLIRKFYQCGWVKSLGLFVLNTIITIVVILAIIIPIRLYVFEPFVAVGQSMAPSIKQGDYLIIEKLSSKYNRDDVVVMRVADTTQYIIKRIVGLPNEKIDISNGKILVNGSVINDQFIANPIFGTSSVVLSEGEYYVLGDNQSISKDSRILGPIQSADIVGKVFYK